MVKQNLNLKKIKYQRVKQQDMRNLKSLEKHIN